MFDTTKPIEIRIKSGGVKSAVVRWPTDEEWAKRARRKKTVRKVLGRGKTSSEVVNSASANSALWSDIVQEPVHADEAEIAAFINRIEYTDLLDFERRGEQFLIRMQITDFTCEGEPVFVTEHLMRQPTQAQVQKYGRSSVTRIDEPRQTISTVHLEPGGQLYDELVVSTTGYSGQVPIIHKDDVVVQLISLISMDDDDPEH